MGIARGGSTRTSRLCGRVASGVPRCRTDEVHVVQTKREVTHKTKGGHDGQAAGKPQGFETHRSNTAGHCCPKMPKARRTQSDKPPLGHSSLLWGACGALN